MKPSVSSRRAAPVKKKKSRIARYTADTLPEPTEKDWARLAAVRDEQIDCSELPVLEETFWKNARMMPPLIQRPGTNKKAVSLRIDPDVLTWFKEQGSRYQSRINAVLRAYVEANKSE